MNIPEPPPSAPSHFMLIANTEGRMLFVGLILAVALAMLLGIGWYLYPKEVLVYSVMTSLNFVIGRATGMAFGYASGFTHVQVVPFNILVETIQVMVVYPLFVLSWKQLIIPRRLQPYFTRMHRAAETRRNMVHKFGIAGLFVFVFVPFWMTGPVVGAIIGYLIGLRPWVNLGVVLASTYLAIGVWALLLNELSIWAVTFNHYAPYALVIAIALIITVMQLIHRRHNRSSIARTTLEQ